MERSEVLFGECLATLYGESSAPLSEWEAESLAVAFLALTTRSQIIESYRGESKSIPQILGDVLSHSRADWTRICNRIASPQISDSIPSLPELLMLTTGLIHSNDTRILTSHLPRSADLLRLSHVVDWAEDTAAQLHEVAKAEVMEFPDRFHEALAYGPAAVRRTLNGYHLARKTLLATGRITQ
ncbi:MAG: hypothetical protein U0996_08055 [Planctomycetaceae bacterium]